MYCGIIKFRYQVASCWSLLLSHTTMHGSMNIKNYIFVCCPHIAICHIRTNHRMTVFEDKLLTITFRSKREDIRRFQRKVPYKELRDLCFLTNIVSVTKSRIRWVERVVCNAEKKSAYRGMLRKREGKSPLGRPGR